MIYRTIALSFAFLIISCGSEEEKTATPPSAESAFVGTWETACTNLGAAGSLKSSQTFNSDKTAAIDVVSYSDTNCTIKSLQQQFAYTFSVTGDAEQSSKAVEFTLVSVKQTQNDDTSVGAANTFKSCGIENWQKGVTVDCTDKPINSTTDADTNAGFRKGNKSTSKLKIEGTKLTNIENAATVYTKK